MFDNIKMDATILPSRKDWQGDAIHWKITLNAKHSLEYSEGIGHFVNTHHALANKMISQPIIKQLRENGKYKQFMLGSNGTLTLKDIKGLFTDRIKYSIKDGTLTVTPPTIKDVFYSLTMAASGDLSSFEEWCSEYGYETDSRKAYKMFEACRDNLFMLHGLGLNPSELQEFYQEY